MRAKKIKPIPMRGVMPFEDWQAGRTERRKIGNLVAPRVIRRKKSSSDRRLKRLYGGKRGLPFVQL